MLVHQSDDLKPKLLEYRMKFFILTSTTAISFAIFKEALFPNFHLTLILALVVIMDLISGIMKSVSLCLPVVSRKLRRTVTKATMYGLMIVLSYIFRSVTVNHGMVIDLLGMWINNGVIFFLIYIEVVSILENIIEMDEQGKGTLSKIVKPLHLLLTWKAKNAMLELMGKEYDEQHKNKNNGTTK